MKTPYQIFKKHPELLDNPEVQELVSQYDTVCDELIDLKQVTEKSKEQPLRVLIKEITESISKMHTHNDEAARFGYDDKLDYEVAVRNLQSYVSEYLRDYQIYL